MPFRGGRGGGFRGGRGGMNRFSDGPPDSVVELGTSMHPCQEDLVCRCTNAKVPYFNAPVYLENKSKIGKVDEIFGQIREFYFSVKMDDNMQASSFSKDTKFFIDPKRLLPLERFIAPAKSGKVTKPRGGALGGRGRGRGRGGGGFRGGGRGGGGFKGRGGGGGFRGRGGGRGSFRGGGGGFKNRGGGGFRGRN